MFCELTRDPHSGTQSGLEVLDKDFLPFKEQRVKWSDEKYQVAAALITKQIQFSPDWQLWISFEEASDGRKHGAERHF